MSAAYSSAQDVTDAVVRVACAGDRSTASRANTAKAVRALMDDGYRLELMIATGLLEEVLALEPGLRARLAVFVRERRD